MQLGPHTIRSAGHGMSLKRLLCVVCTIALAPAAVFGQDAQIFLPGASGETAVFDASNNLVVVNRTVPPGFADLYMAYDGVYRNPVVVVEGFDPLNSSLPSDIYAQINPRGGLDAIRAAGRSVWIVNFGDGGGAIAANARLVSSAISQAANYAGLSGAQVDVLGISMGGVVSRYALAYDEEYAGPSDGLVRLFVSGDSPQQGANGNPGFQELVLFQNDPATLPSVTSDASISMLYTSVRSYSTNGCLLGALPSGSNYVASSAAHDWFYGRLNDLNGGGYPLKSRNVAVANGSWNPLPYAVGSPLFDCRTYATWPWRFQVCSERYYALAADVGAGSLAGDYSPGNIREPSFELDQHFVPCFIPTVSALDVRGGVSMFDRTLVQATSQNHSAITQDTNDFLLEEVLRTGWRINVRSMPDGATANINGRVVTGVYDELVYVEEPDRAWGIGVTGAAGVSEGDVISVLGPMATVAGERRVLASEVNVLAHGGQVPAPLAMRARNLGGGAFGTHTPGVVGGTGCNNVGLLVRLTGRVTGVASDSSFFCIDDGSGRTDDSGWAGVRVTLAGLEPGVIVTPPKVGEQVVITGVCSVYTGVSGLQPQVRPRRQSDVVVL